MNAPILQAADRRRMGKQLGAILSVMLGGSWWSLEGLVEALRLDGIRAISSGVSARIRELPHLGYAYEKKHVGGGLYRYRLTGEWIQVEPRRQPRHCNTCCCHALGGANP